jgi:hypothetical protein
VTATDFVPAASGTGANPSGLCGATPCILLFGTTGPAGKDDKQASNN